MAKGRRHDAKGRSTTVKTPKRRKMVEPFMMVPGSLLASPGYRALSINARKVLDRIRLEHLLHGGQENGNLIVTYSQFVEYGATRECIAEALAELEMLGLVAVEERGGLYEGEHRPNRYRLTEFHTRDGAERTDDWKRVSEEDAARAKDEIAAKRRARQDYRSKHPGPSRKPP